MRVWATHAWPLFMMRVAAAARARAAARSASSRMIAADLPPSSRVQRFSCSPQSAPIWRPAFGRAGEAHLVDAAMGHEVLARLTVGGHDVEDAGRDAGLLDELGQHQRARPGSRGRA